MCRRADRVRIPCANRHVSTIGHPHLPDLPESARDKGHQGICYSLGSDRYVATVPLEPRDRPCRAIFELCSQATCAPVSMTPDEDLRLGLGLDLAEKPYRPSCHHRCNIWPPVVLDAPFCNMGHPSWYGNIPTLCDGCVKAAQATTEAVQFGFGPDIQEEMRAAAWEEIYTQGVEKKDVAYLEAQPSTSAADRAVIFTEDRERKLQAEEENHIGDEALDYLLGGPDRHTAFINKYKWDDISEPEFDVFALEKQRSKETGEWVCVRDVYGPVGFESNDSDGGEDRIRLAIEERNIEVRAASINYVNSEEGRRPSSPPVGAREHPCVRPPRPLGRWPTGAFPHSRPHAPLDQLGVSMRQCQVRVMMSSLPQPELDLPVHGVDGLMNRGPTKGDQPADSPEASDAGTNCCTPSRPASADGSEVVDVDSEDLSERQSEEFSEVDAEEARSKISENRYFGRPCID